MKAIWLTAPGDVDCLVMSEVAMPQLTSPEEIRVQLHAAGVNPVDCKMRQRGTFRPEKLPAILGCDGAGVVESVGPAVTRFKVGDGVYFFNGGIGTSVPGNYAEYTVIHQDYAALKPKNLSMVEAAAVPLAWITAWESLVDRAQVQANQTVLIHAGAGGVGHVAIQLAKILKATVATTVSNPEKAEFAKSLGADLVINYRQTDFTKAALEWTQGQGVEVVMDNVGGDVCCQSISATRIYGRLVTILDLTCPEIALKSARLRNIHLIQELMLTPLYLQMHEARIAQRCMLEEATKWLEAGRLTVKVSQVFPLAQVAEAHRLIEAGSTLGKIVLLTQI